MSKSIKWVKDEYAGFRAEIGDVVIGACPQNVKPTKGFGFKAAPKTKWRAVCTILESVSCRRNYGPVNETLYDSAKEAKAAAEKMFKLAEGQ